MSIPAIDTADFLIDIQSKFNNKGTEQAISAVREVKSEIGSFIKRADLGESSVRRFISSFGRIAKLRMMRAAIRAVGKSIKEGTEDLYHYSQALNNADASQFASTMDSLASSMLYMKNSIGAVVAPLLTSLLPAIQQVVSWFVTAMNVIAQFFAVLGGQSTYTRAKEHATVWKDVSSSIGGATAAAKEYQNTILSFDEIHALNDTPSGGGGGGSGGKAVPDYSDMFEEAEVADTWLNKVAKFLKDNFEDVLDIVKTIGTVLLGWKIAQKVTDFFGRWFGGAKNAATAMLGITMMITGFTLETKGAFDIGYSGADLGNMIKTAIGAALGIAGTAITFAGLGLGATAGLGLGIIASLTILLTGIKVGQMEAYLDATVRATDQYRELAKIIEHADSTQGTFLEHAREIYDNTLKLEDATSDYGITSDVVYGESLLKRIKELAGKTELTADETTELEAKCRILNGLGLEGIQVEFDELTGKVTANWEELDKNIEKIKELAKTEAAFELLKEAYRTQFELEIEHKRLLDDNAEASDAYKQAVDEFRKVQEKSADGTIHYDKETKAARETMIQAKDAFDKSKEALDEVDEAMRINDRTIGILEGDMSTERVEVAKAASATSDLNDELNEMNGTQVDTSKVVFSIDEIKRAANNAYWKLKGVNEELATMASNAVTASLNGINIAINAQQKANGGIVGYANGGIPRFDGGGINSANLFMAHENGMPELVGRIGNRTAVANTGQMVDAMAQGVYEAMSQFGGTSNIEVVVNMDGETVARAADRGNKSLNRRFNVSLA